MLSKPQFTLRRSLSEQGRRVQWQQIGGGAAMESPYMSTKFIREAKA